MYKELRVDTALLVKSIHDEAVRKIREDFQHLDMGIFDHILSGRVLSYEKNSCSMFFSKQCD